MESYMKLVGPFLMLNLLGKTKKNWIKVEKKKNYCLGVL